MPIKHTDPASIIPGPFPTGNRFIPLEQKTYGRLTVLGFAGRRMMARGSTLYWNCLCECGTRFATSSSALRSGDTISCGCWNSKAASGRFSIHRMSGRPEHDIWMNMRTRCENERDPRYINYGKRGIRVCDEWQDFETFFTDMGPRPTSKHTLERNDNDGHYEKSNCRWATRREQARNTRRNRVVTYNGQTRCLVEWVEKLGVRYSTIQTRLVRGWSIERALTEPVHVKAATLGL